MAATDPTIQTLNVTVSSTKEQWNIPGTDITIYTIQDDEGHEHKTMSPTLGMGVGKTFVGVEQYKNAKGNTYLRLPRRKPDVEPTEAQVSHSPINIDEIPF
jgi:hypothetical protein